MLQMSENTYRVLCLICLKRKKRDIVFYFVGNETFFLPTLNEARTMMSMMERMVPILVDLESSAAVKFCL